MTTLDKKRATRQAIAIDKVADTGVNASRRTMREIRKAVDNAFVNGHDAGEAAAKTLMTLAPTLSQGMVTSHLMALERINVAKNEILELGLFSRVTTVYSKSIGKLKRLLGMTTEELEVVHEKYEAVAVETLFSEGDRIKQDINRLVQEAIELQLPTRAAVVRINRGMSSLGWSNTNPYSSETVFRTQSAIAYSAANWQGTMLDPDVSDIIWGFIWQTAGDNRVRDEHVGFDGMTLPKDDPTWQTTWPPAGYNCRCIAIPVFEPRKIVQPTASASVDEGFKFNSGIVTANPLL